MGSEVNFLPGSTCCVNAIVITNEINTGCMKTTLQLMATFEEENVPRSANASMLHGGSAAAVPPATGGATNWWTTAALPLPSEMRAVLSNESALLFAVNQGSLSTA